MKKLTKIKIRTGRRAVRVRARIREESLRPRLSVFRSSANIYAQLIDDRAGATRCSASTQEKEIAAYGGNKAAAALVGKRLAERAKALGITEVVFDRGAYKYHGRVKALAEAAREAGLKF